jgi:hypothetical protein
MIMQLKIHFFAKFSTVEVINNYLFERGSVRKGKYQKKPFAGSHVLLSHGGKFLLKLLKYKKYNI